MFSGSKWRQQTRKPSHFGSHSATEPRIFRGLQGDFDPHTLYPGTKKYPSFTISRTYGGLKKDPFFREIRNAGAAPPLYLSAPPPGFLRKTNDACHNNFMVKRVYSFLLFTRGETCSTTMREWKINNYALMSMFVSWEEACKMFHLPIHPWCNLYTLLLLALKIYVHTWFASKDIPRKTCGSLYVFCVFTDLECYVIHTYIHMYIYLYIFTI